MSTHVDDKARDMKRFFPFLILLAIGCSNPTDSPLELANAFQKAVEREDFETAYDFIDESLKEQTIPDDLELFFSSEESVLSGEASGKLLPVVASYPTFRIIEFSDSNPVDSCGITDIVVVRNRDNVWSVVWADHLSAEVTLALDIHPFSTRCAFFQKNYVATKLDDLIPNERFIRIREIKNQLNRNAVFNLNHENKWQRAGIYQIDELMTPPKLIFHLGARPWVERAIDTYLNENQCFNISKSSDWLGFLRSHNDILIALAQYLLLKDKDRFWTQYGEDEKSVLLPNDGVDFGDFATFESPSKYWVLSSYLGATPPDIGHGLSYEQKREAWQTYVLEKQWEFVNETLQQLEADKPNSEDLIKAIQLLSFVTDKEGAEYLTTMSLAESKLTPAQGRDEAKSTESIPNEVANEVLESEPQLSSSELQICEQSFSGMRDFYEPFELEEFCSCVFHSSAGFETFLDSPGEYLKENEDCLARYLFRPAGMSEDDIESYWTGVDRASQPVTRDGFATSCAKGLLTLPEFKEVEYSSAREFCVCIYDEAEGKGLAMDDLMNSAGDDIAEACGHLISP